MTFKKEINDVTNNDVVLKVCGKIAESMAVPYSRITDAYGGFFGSPSATLPAKAAAAATTTKTTTATTTANKTRVLATNTTNATAKPAEYKIDVFAQPDPFAAKVDNANTVTLLTGTAVSTAVGTVTTATYGAFTAAAAAVKEAAVKWTKKPVATGGAK